MAAKACSDAALQLAECMDLKSPCVAAGSTIGEAVKKTECIVGCESHHTAYFLCRRGQLDMRTRIRGKRYQDNTATEQ